MLYLRTFGGLALQNGVRSANANAGQRARHAMLAVLAATGDHGVSRDRLLALFWPESDADRARGALKQALYTLRNEFGVRELTLGGSVLRLNPEAIGSDVADFDMAIRARNYERAVELYAGPFLDGFHLSGLAQFDGWLERERERLMTQHCGALRELALSAENAGVDAVAIGWWKKLAGVDRLGASPALSLVKALVRAGDRAAALQHARAYQALVRTELDVDADPAIEALAAKIRSGGVPDDFAAVGANGRSHGGNGGRTAVLSVVPANPAARDPAAAQTAGGEAPGSTVQTMPTAGTALTRHPAAWVGALGILLIGVMMGALAMRREDMGMPMRFPVNLDGGLRLAAVATPLALSPDGTILAFVAVKDSGAPRLFVRPVGDLQARELPETEDASQLFFSRDGRWIGFHTRGLLKRVAVTGGPPALIGEVPQMFGGSWTSGDDIVVSSAGAIAVIPAGGGALRRISSPDSSAGEISQRWPIVLDDGTIVYTARGKLLEKSRIAVMSLDGRNRRILDLVGTAPLAVVNGYLLFSTAKNLITPQNAIMAARWNQGRRQVDGAPLVVVEQVGLDVQGAARASISSTGSLAYYFQPEDRYQLVLTSGRDAPRPVMDSGGPFAFPRFSPDGRRIAINFDVGRGNSKVTVFDRESGTLTLLTTEQAGYPEWTADGKRLFFLRPRLQSLWSKPVDLSEPEQLLVRSDSLDIKEGVMSRDGRVLVVRGAHVRDSTHEIWYRYMSGDTTLRPLVLGPAVKVAPRISPDGKWVAYATSESGNHVFVTSLSGAGSRYQVSLDRGWSPVWSPDGHRLYYFRGQQLIAATLRFSPSFAVLAREVVLEGNYAAHGFHAQFDVSPDGREFLLLKDVSPESRMIFVHDWTRELRDRTAAPSRRR